ncbi:MAG TPA: hypothetical protein VGU44_01605 [Gammaproteobacteria bacterium]|nr:hypothetical protein [Gammaproteobacteria bacterium]
MPTGRHTVDHEKHHMHSKHEFKKKREAHRHKVPGYVARELARTDVPKEIAKAEHDEGKAQGAPPPRLPR